MKHDFSSGYRVSVLPHSFLCSLHAFWSLKPLKWPSFLITHCLNSFLGFQTKTNSETVSDPKPVPIIFLLILFLCYAALIGSFLPTFRDSLSLPSSRIKQSMKNSSLPINQRFLKSHRAQSWHHTNFFAVSQEIFLIIYFLHSFSSHCSHSFRLWHYQRPVSRNILDKAEFGHWKSSSSSWKTLRS